MSSLVLAATVPASAAVEALDRAAPVAAAGAPATPLVSPSFGSLPISFELNVGQEPAGVRFLTRGSTATLTATGARLQGGRRPVTLEFIGASRSAFMAGTNELAGKANYFVGNDPSAWKTNVPTYASVRVGQLYPGVDLVWYGRGPSLEYDLVLEAGADPGAVKFSLDGAPSPEIDPDGALVAGDVRFERPVAYQEIDGERRTVPCGYVTNDEGRVGFRLGDYDRSLPLIIDPEIGYTYTFADASKDISIFGIAVDSTGGAYVAGRTRTTGPGGVLSTDAFVAKLNAAGTSIVYSTTIGGTASDEAFDIAVDSAGSAFITGSTESSNFPSTAGAFQPAKGSPNGSTDAFVSKLGPDGDSFVYSSFLGGTGGSNAAAIAVDASNNAYVTGRTFGGFPLATPSQGTIGGMDDAFVAKVNAVGSSKVYSTYFGGALSDAGSGIAVDSSGSAYVVGQTMSTNLSVSTGALQPTPGGGTDGFWVRYDSAGQRMATTYLGGSGFDRSADVAVDSAGTSYLTGETDSGNFPLVAAFQTTIAGDRDVFLASINGSGTALGFSTLFGGSDWDYGTAIGLDASGRIYAAGTTRSRDLPVVDPIQETFGGGSYDAFVLQVLPGVPAASGRTPAGPSVGSATYHGGAGSERGEGVNVTASGTVIVASEHPKDSTGGHDEGDVTTFEYGLLRGPDLFVRMHTDYTPFKDLATGERFLAIYVQVRSEYTCDEVLVPDAVFGLEIPLGLVFERAFGKYGSRVVSTPDVDQPGVVTFRLDRPVTHSDDTTDGGTVLVKLSRTTPPQGFVQVDAFAETSVFECFYSNNIFPGLVNPLKLHDFRPGGRLLTIVPLSNPTSPPVVSILGNAIAATPSTRDGNRAPSGGLRYNVYSGTQPGVQTIPANLFASVPAEEADVDVSEAPPNSYFVVTTVTDSGESAPSNEVGGILPEVTKLKVSATKIVAQGSGFANDVRIFFGESSFVTAPRLKSGNSKVIQKGRLVTGLTLGELFETFLAPGTSILVTVVNGNGNGVVVEYRR